MNTAPQRIGIRLALAQIVVLAWTATAACQTANPKASADHAAQKAWIEQHLAEKAAKPFFSLLYDGKPVADVLPSWRHSQEVRALEEQRRRITVTWRDPATRLAIRCEAVEYHDFPAVEWVLHLKNEGPADTPILSDVRPLAVSVAATTATACSLNYAKGGVAGLDDFRPELHAIKPDTRFELRSAGGRSSNGVLPFFNVQLGGRGVIEALGWTGNWAAGFDRAGDGHLSLAAGMQRTHFKLLPGESVRTPRVLLLFWQGDRQDSQNLLRRFLLAHHNPLPKGRTRAGLLRRLGAKDAKRPSFTPSRRLSTPRFPSTSIGSTRAGTATSRSRRDSTDANSQWWKYTGSWRPNKSIYPHGLAPIGEMLRKHQMGFLLWIEAERVFRGTDLQRQHPDWLLGPQGDNFLVNLGHPAARQGITDIVSSLVREGGLAWYRQDFNTDPEKFWSTADAPTGPASPRSVTSRGCMLSGTRSASAILGC